MMAPMNLAAVFAKSVATHAVQPAIFWGDERWTYENVHGLALHLCRELQGRLGVKPGDRVALWLKNRPEFVPALFGVLQAGAVVVPINNFLKPDEVNFILQDAGIDVMITEEGAGTTLRRLKELRPGLSFWMVESLVGFRDLPPCPPPALPDRTRDDLAIIIYTSGTTGHPKGAMLTNGNLLHNVESCRQVLSAVDHDRFVVLLPLFHSFMLTVGVLLPMLVGGSLVLIKSLHPARNVIEEICRHGGTILPAIPQFFRTLAHAPVPPDWPLRLCISGAAPLPGEVLREFNARMPIPLLEGYGLSEASPVVSMNPVQGPWKAGSIGLPIPGVEISVQDEDGHRLPTGATGEICVRGGNVMQGYWNQPGETARTLRDGWLLTGDVGHADADGYFYITDRKKDMLLVNGINVYPREIEEVIYQFSGVKEAAVIGMPDARKGEQPVAYLAVNDGAQVDVTALHHFLKQKLADYKVPKRIVLLPALPRNATGKVLKTELRKLPPSE
jgi:long-chain acyl-CoA synthetase